LIQTLQRQPTIEEVALKSTLTIEQIQNAIDARASPSPDPCPTSKTRRRGGRLNRRRPENAFLLEALAHLSEIEQAIIRLYMEGLPHEEIARVLGLTASNVTSSDSRVLRQAPETP